MDAPMTPAVGDSSVTAAYDPANQIENWGTDTFAYDNAGRIVRKTSSGQTTDYNFNYEDRLTRVTEGSNTYEYLYNGLGERLASRINGTETRYVLDRSSGMANVLCETGTDGTVNGYYIYGAGLLYRINADGTRTNYHFDQIGSTLALSDESGTITDSYAYTPFGKVAIQGSTHNPFQYVGEYGVMQEGNGLLFMRARFYDPVNKRFLSRDPVKGNQWSSQGANPYPYAQNNPIIAIDPNGEIALLFVPAIAGVVSGTISAACKIGENIASGEKNILKGAG